MRPARHPGSDPAATSLPMQRSPDGTFSTPPGLFADKCCQYTMRAAALPSLRRTREEGLLRLDRAVDFLQSGFGGYCPPAIGWIEIE